MSFFVFRGFLVGTTGSERQLWLRTPEHRLNGSHTEDSLGGAEAQGSAQIPGFVQSSAWPDCSLGATWPLFRILTSLGCPRISSHQPALPSRTSALKLCSLWSSLRCWLLPRMGRTITSGRQRGARQPSRRPSPLWWTRQVGTSLGHPGPSAGRTVTQGGHELEESGPRELSAVTGAVGVPPALGSQGHQGWGLWPFPVPCLCPCGGREPPSSAPCWLLEKRALTSGTGFSNACQEQCWARVSSCAVTGTFECFLGCFGSFGVLKFPPVFERPVGFGGSRFC